MFIARRYVFYIFVILQQVHLYFTTSSFVFLPVYHLTGIFGPSPLFGDPLIFFILLLKYALKLGFSDIFEGVSKKGGGPKIPVRYQRAPLVKCLYIFLTPP